MRKTLGAIVALALIGLANAAFAGEASGTIVDTDMQTRTIRLDDGSTYMLSEGVALESLRPGMEVTVSYEEKDGQNTATEVKPAN